MQKLPVYLYPNLFEVVLDLDDNKELYPIMYQRALEIQKGVRNTIQLQFKNSDQKLLDVSTQTFVLNVFDSVDHTLIMQKSVGIPSALSTATVYKGIGTVIFNERDTLDVDSKSYKFSVVKVEDDGSTSPTYANTYYGVAGTLQIKNEIYPVLKPSYALSTFQRVYNSAPTKMQWEWYSGNIKADPALQDGNALHTISTYLTRFKGKVIIEGTLENTPGPFANYAVINTVDYNNFTGVDYYNFNGVFTNIRVRYIPNKNPIDNQNNDPTYTGTFDKFLYRS